MATTARQLLAEFSKTILAAHLRSSHEQCWSRRSNCHC